MFAKGNDFERKFINKHCEQKDELTQIWDSLSIPILPAQLQVKDTLPELHHSSHTHLGTLGFYVLEHSLALGYGKYSEF